MSNDSGGSVWSEFATSELLAKTAQVTAKLDGHITWQDTLYLPMISSNVIGVLRMTDKKLPLAAWPTQLNQNIGSDPEWQSVFQGFFHKVQNSEHSLEAMASMLLGISHVLCRLDLIQQSQPNSEGST